MNLYLRVLILFIRSLFKPKLQSILDGSVLNFYVLPNDLDINGHMNNSRYLTIMDLGRFDLVLRSGLLTFMRQHKSVPILGAAQIRFRIPLMPFQKYELHTRIMGWDEKWAYMEQKFVITNGPKKDAVAAIALVKGSFYDSVNKGHSADKRFNGGISGLRWKAPLCLNISSIGVMRKNPCATPPKYPKTPL